MATLAPPGPVELMPPVAQKEWGWPAVVNFVLGGLGAGFYMMAAVAARFGPSPPLRIASWLGPALVLAGFVVVATEAGRPLRGLRVVTRVRTSWMSRELWLGGAFTVLAAGEFALRVPGHQVLAVLAAAALALAQGFMLRGARGIAAWDVPVMPLVFLSSAFVSGMGLLMLVEVAQGAAPGDRLFAAVLVLLIVNMLVWQTFLAWSRDQVFVHCTRSLREGWTRTATVVGGYLAPALLVAPVLVLPALAMPAAAVGGVLMILSQLHVKAALILTAGQLRPITIARLRPVRRPG